MLLQTQCAQGRNKAMSEGNRIKYVGFRLTNEEYTQIESAVAR